MIWFDEMSVTMGGQRGCIQVWRITSEVYSITSIAFDVGRKVLKNLFFGVAFPMTKRDLVTFGKMRLLKKKRQQRLGWRKRMLSWNLLIRQSGSWRIQCDRYRLDEICQVRNQYGNGIRLTANL